MKIHEVEALAGISKVNIRYYESEGLLTPRRNSENGYRTYEEQDVELLKKIKLLRMLDIPIEEIRRLQAGTLTLEDAMGRHLIQLERRRSSLDTMTRMCTRLRDSGETLSTLDADAVLASMNEAEQEGTHFVQVSQTDVVQRMAAPLICAAAVLLLLAAVFGVVLYCCIADPEFPVGVGVAVMVPLVLIGAGILAALGQRLQEIKKGEEDEAKKY